MCSFSSTSHEIHPFHTIVPISVKKVRSFTNDSRTITWNASKCQHEGKCLANIVPPIEQSGIASFAVTDQQFEEMLTQSGICPSGALCLVVR